MKTVLLSVCVAFAFFVASAVAQVAPSGAQGTQNSSPTMSQPGQNPTQQQPGMDQTTQDQNTTNQNQNNGEHTIKGCVQSQGGSSMLETKKGKEIALSGQDVSAHNGHEVALKGTWEKGSSMSATSSGNGNTSGKTFNVTSVKMISETCKMKGSSANSGTSATPGSPSGTGQSTQQPQ